MVRDAQELRIKETDRIATVAENFKRMGIEIEVTPDGMRVPGKQKFRAAAFDSFGDHRIAMAFAVAALRGGWRIDDRQCRCGFGIVSRVLEHSGANGGMIARSVGQGRAAGSSRWRSRWRSRFAACRPHIGQFASGCGVSDLPWGADAVCEGRQVVVSTVPRRTVRHSGGGGVPSGSDEVCDRRSFRRSRIAAGDPRTGVS